MAKELHTHIDRMDSIEEAINNDINDIITQIDRDLLINDPQAALMEAVGALRAAMIEKYIPEASNNGIELAEKIEGLNKPLMVDSSKDPKENHGLL